MTEGRLDPPLGQYGVCEDSEVRKFTWVICVDRGQGPPPLDKAAFKVWQQAVEHIGLIVDWNGDEHVALRVLF